MTQAPATVAPAVPAPSAWAVGMALLAVYVVWGSTYFVMHVALESFPPFIMGALRFAVAGGLLYVSARVRGAGRPTLAQWRAAAIVGTLLFAGGNGGVAFAQQSVSSGLTAVVVATMPLFAAIFALLWRQRPSAGEWAGLLVGFGGVAVLNARGEISASGLMGVVLVLSPVAWALGSVWSRHLPQGNTAAMTSATQMLCGSVAMAVVALLRGETVDLAHVTPRALVALVYLITFGSLLGFSAYAFLLRSTRPAIATSYAYVNPAVALMLGASFADEHVDALTVFGTCIILIGVAITSWAARRAANKAMKSTVISSQ